MGQPMMGTCQLCLGAFKAEHRHRKYCSDCVPLIQFDKRLKTTLKEFEQDGWKEKLQDAVAGSKEP